MAFQVGSRVRVKDGMAFTNKKTVGIEGTVVGYYMDNPNIINVEWDLDVHGHNCEGKAKYGHGWNYPVGSLELVEYDADLSVDDFI